MSIYCLHISSSYVYPHMYACKYVFGRERGPVKETKQNEVWGLGEYEESS